MSIRTYYRKVKNLTFNKLITLFLRRIRIVKYRLLSNCKDVTGEATFNTPVLINGLGKVQFGNNIHLGAYGSPMFFSTYIYIEARNPSSIIVVEDNVYMNNNACIISEGEGIYIEKDVLIGPNFNVYDSDFHDLNPLKRHSGSPKTKKVIIRKNVFIGSNVTILKGVEIGENSVIASGSVVTKSIDKNVIAGGNPCKVLKSL
ncbi:maltose O-acetyltransferase [Pedobacter cryoconitis]|uniref:acyltransferase n=1 Tax=Pedobacter cryoconitis TaxID=188932 RepID=UPI0016081D56|nr:acyltransferase [Pedobacter cryoconitis]MBB6271538.1 maltose O-acetyltransferase [Pedobacter cryoconitis]